jgi:predicted nucleic acid-binding protein
LVKLYLREQGHDVVASLTNLVVSALARVEVSSALWRSVRTGESAPDDGSLLEAAFAWDWYDGQRFVVIELGEAVLKRAARLVAVHEIRAADAIQLASALAAREADPRCATLACFDQRLRAAGAMEGFTLVP